MSKRPVPAHSTITAESDNMLIVKRLRSKIPIRIIGKVVEADRRNAAGSVDAVIKVCVSRSSKVANTYLAQS